MDDETRDTDDALPTSDGPQAVDASGADSAPEAPEAPGLLERLRTPLFIVGALALVAWLSAGAVQRNDVYMTSMEEFDPIRARADRIRVAGWVADDSIDQERERLVTRFRLRDEAGAVAVPVRYDGVLPDLFTEGGQVVATGQLNDSGTFVAEHLMTKCPSKYEALEAEPTPGNSPQTAPAKTAEAQREPGSVEPS
ncbi:MAG: cytochrome c maturation protein CcmE [Acidobacteriota bacterium]